MARDRAGPAQASTSRAVRHVRLHAPGADVQGQACLIVAATIDQQARHIMLPRSQGRGFERRTFREVDTAAAGTADGLDELARRRCLDHEPRCARPQREGRVLGQVECGPQDDRPRNDAAASARVVVRAELMVSATPSLPASSPLDRHPRALARTMEERERGSAGRHCPPAGATYRTGSGASTDATLTGMTERPSMAAGRSREGDASGHSSTCASGGGSGSPSSRSSASCSPESMARMR